jgi:hypothetical protein
MHCETTGSNLNPSNTGNEKKLSFMQRLRSKTNSSSMREHFESDDPTYVNKEIDLEDNGVFIGEAKLVIQQDTRPNVS